MPLPRMTVKRWFWSVTVLVAVYLAMALRHDAAERREQTAKPGEGRAMRAQGGVGSVLQTLLMPATWAFSRAQNLISPAPSEKGNAQLREQNLAQQSEISQLQTELNRRINELRELKHMPDRYPSLSQASVLTQVNVIGRSFSGASDVITLDCGQRDHVVKGMLVISSFAPVGVVTSVGPLSSTVQLITDSNPGSQIQVSIKRIEPGNPTQKIIKAVCEVQGIGEGRLTCRTVSLNNPDVPAIGDILVVKEDNQWRPLDGAFVGVVDKVERDEAHVAYVLSIRPYADIAALRQVWVVLLPP